MGSDTFIVAHEGFLSIVQDGRDELYVLVYKQMTRAVIIGEKPFSLPDVSCQVDLIKIANHPSSFLEDGMIEPGSFLTYNRDSSSWVIC